MATVTLLACKSLMFRYMGQFWTGTATSGSTTTLVDPTLIDMGSTDFPFPVEGKQLRITSLITDLRRIAKVDHATGTLYPNRAFSSAATTNTYEVWSNSINGGAPLSRLFNDILQVARPLSQTQVTIVTNQRIYDVTTLVTSPEDITEVYVRYLDSSGVEPYRPEPIRWWNCYPLISANVQALKLELGQTLTLNSPATEELWVEHYKKLTDFVDDTSTVDATYAEWLAWEAVLRHSLDMATQDADKGRWSTLARRAAAQVKVYRKRFMPMKAKRTMHGRPEVM